MFEYRGDNSIYLASSYKHRETLTAEARRFFSQAGMVVVSRWLDETPFDPTLGAAVELIRKVRLSQADTDDVIAGRFLVLLSDEGTGHVNVSGGKHSELGMAIILKQLNPSREIIVVGGKERNIFQNHPLVKHVCSKEMALVLMREKMHAMAHC